MKRTKILLILAAVGVIAAGYGLYAIGLKQGMNSVLPMATTTAPATEKKILYWHDPMVPGHKFDKPGKSPFMDMQLVPMYADDGQGAGSEGQVGINPRVQQNLGIRTADVVKGKLASAIEAVGSVVYNERDVALLQARSNGYVERLYVRAVQDHVRKGQAMAQLYVPDWVAAQEEYLAIRRMDAKLSNLPALESGARQRMRLAGMSDEQIAAVTRSGKLHTRLTISAPMGGIVTELAVREGSTVMAGAPMFRINALETIWVNAEIPENDAAQIRPGMQVEARAMSLGGAVFKGKVAVLLPEVNSTTRTVKARIELRNPDQLLLPGMFVNVRLTAAAPREALLVPSEAVIQTGQRNVVMLALDGGKFKPVDVEIGTEKNGQTEIRSGLEAGQKVVVSGQFLIDSEASLKGTSTRMSDMPISTGDKKPAMESSQAPTGTHSAEGKIEEIDTDSLMISHGPVPSLKWGPMTMGFQPPADGLPKQLAVGDSVVFEFRPAKDGVFIITSMTRKDAAAASASASTASQSGASKSGASK